MKILILIIFGLPEWLNPFNVKLDIQYVKDIGCHVVSPYANTNEADCLLFEKGLSLNCEKINDRLWTNEELVITKTTNVLGSYYIICKKE